MCQLRSGNTKDTRGTAYVVYEDIYDAKAAADHLSGFNVANRYLIVLYYAPSRQAKKLDRKKEEAELEEEVVALVELVLQDPLVLQELPPRWQVLQGLQARE